MAKENNKLIALIAVMVFAAIGIVLSNFLEEFLNGFNSTGIVGDIIKIIKSPGLLAGLLWLIVCIVCYIGVGKAFAEGKKIGPISLMFLLLWLFTNLGLIIGQIVWFLIKGQSISLTLDGIVAILVLNMALSLGPSFAAALGISNID